MEGRYVSFRTQEKKNSNEWYLTGAEILRRLGDGLQSFGFTVDFEAGRDEPGWVFAAHRGNDLVVVRLSITTLNPFRWIIALESDNYQYLETPTRRKEIHPILETIVVSWPGTSEIRWHVDHTTLGELGEKLANN